ncbi:hypothetical protein RUND412_001541 [Rhizina undulata]
MAKTAILFCYSDPHLLHHNEQPHNTKPPAISNPRPERSPSPSVTLHPADEPKGLIPVRTGFCLFTPNSFAGDPFAIPKVTADDGTADIAVKNKAFLKKRNIRFPRLYKEVCGLHITPYYEGYGSVKEGSPLDMLLALLGPCELKFELILGECERTRTGRKRQTEYDLEQVYAGPGGDDGSRPLLTKKVKMEDL